MQSKTPTPAEIIKKLKAMHVRASSAEAVVQEIDNPTDFYHTLGKPLDHAVNRFNRARQELLKAAAEIASLTGNIPTEAQIQDYLTPRPGYKRFYGDRNRPDYSKCGHSVWSHWRSYQCNYRANCIHDDQGRPTRCGVHKKFDWRKRADSI